MKEIGQQNIFNNSYENIKSYFDELNQNKDHFTNSNDICTPIDCVKEMVDSVPNNFWQKDIKVLDSCCGNGNFHAYINTKTELSNLYFNEINLKRVDNLITYFGEDINLTTKDFLEFEDKEQYDMVVSNPPYAKFNKKP
jgi:type I restriction-modification system DNA methylase subunit